MNFNEYADKYLSALTPEGRQLVQMGWNGHAEFGDQAACAQSGQGVDLCHCVGPGNGCDCDRCDPQPAQQGSVPEGWSITHIDDPATDGYLIRGPGISYCVWKDKEPWLYLFCEALAATPQPEGEWVKREDRLPIESDGDYNEDVWVYDKALGKAVMTMWADVDMVPEYTHWKPTGLKRPNPPAEQESEQ